MLVASEVLTVTTIDSTRFSVPLYCTVHNSNLCTTTTVVVIQYCNRKQSLCGQSFSLEPAAVVSWIHEEELQMTQLKIVSRCGHRCHFCTYWLIWFSISCMLLNTPASFSSFISNRTTSAVFSFCKLSAICSSIMAVGALISFTCLD